MKQHPCIKENAPNTLGRQNYVPLFCKPKNVAQHIQNLGLLCRNKVLINRTIL